MQCFKCGAQLGAEQTCPNCGMNVKMYKKLIAISNYLYNVGLERAKVRDLSGAADSLKASLQYYKGNIQARNLLGLIYYEMGETVSALSEWVISKNQKGKDNIADSYLHEVQSNTSLLNTVNQTIKKYNQALLYCQQDSEDLAVIQLKKIISTNPKLVKAHQLLALLYIRDRKYDLARKSLRAAEKIDCGNTTTMRYLAEIEGRSGADTESRKPKKKENRVEYRNGTDTIIQPTNLRDNSGWMMILNILVGLVIGVTATYFLIVPSIRQTVQKDANTAVSDANDTIATKNQKIQELESQVAKLTKNVESAKADKETTKTQISSYQRLLAAYQSFQQGGLDEAKEALGQVDVKRLDTEAKQVYDSIQTELNSKYLETAYTEGYNAYMSRSYQQAAELLQKVVDVDDTYHSGDAIYYLAQAYRIIEEYEKAAPLYQKVIDEYPGSYKANNAKYKYLPEVQTKLETE
ncbi:MAG: tetratricopeptide repeat protein [Eubacterium sp.]|nr:tetratricopeptide repeat protein [Eubacterium sp.]